MARYTGGCLCRAVRYSIDAEPIAGRQILCHCVDCQKHTGTAFVSGMAFPADSVVITGEMTTYTMPGGSGEPMNRRFCTRCGSPIMIDKDGTGRKLIMAGWTTSRSLSRWSACSASRHLRGLLCLPTHRTCRDTTRD